MVSIVLSPIIAMSTHIDKHYAKEISKKDSKDCKILNQLWKSMSTPESMWSSTSEVQPLDDEVCTHTTWQ